MHQLLVDLRSFEVTRPARSTHDAQVMRGIEFLKMAQHPDGFWGMGALIDTTMSLRALGLWKPNDRDWQLPSGKPGGIELAFHWLDSVQSGDAWEGNIWDTSAVVRASVRHRMTDRPSVVRAIAWLEAKERTSWGLDEGLPPHYGAQALLALTEARPQFPQTKLCEQLYNIATSDTGLPDRSLYIAGQLLEALVTAGQNRADENIRNLTARIEERLACSEVSIANFLDICSAFLGLAEAYGTVDSSEPVVQRTLSKLLNPNRLREDGSWYRDVTLTAWALVSLSTLQTVRMVEGFPLDVYRAVERASTSLDSVLSADLKRKRETAAAGAGLGASLIFTTITVVLQLQGQIAIPADTNAGWLIVSLLLSMPAFFARLLLTSLR